MKVALPDLNAVQCSIIDYCYLKIIQKSVITCCIVFCKVEVKHRILLKGIIGRVNVESFEKFTLSLEKSMKGRSHQALAVTAGTGNNVIVLQFTLNQAIYILRLIHIDVITFCPQLFTCLLS